MIAVGSRKFLATLVSVLAAVAVLGVAAWMLMGSNDGGPQADADVAFEAEVKSVETSGAETFLHCRVQGADWVARLPGMAEVKAGSTVRLHIDRDDIIRFG